MTAALTPRQLEAGLKAAYAMKNSAKEPSFNANPTAYVEAIGAAVLAAEPDEPPPAA